MQKQLQKKRKEKEIKGKKEKERKNEPTLMKMRNGVSFQRETIHFNILVNISSSVHNISVKEKPLSNFKRKGHLFFRNTALE